MYPIHFDADAWVQATLGVLNDNGGRGYSTGVRIINCPWCDDTRGKGWVNVTRLRMACFEPHCPVHNGINLVEAVRQLQGFGTWTEALVWLRHEFPLIGPAALPPKPPSKYDDWVKWPKGTTPLVKDFKPNGIIAAEALRFAQMQWGITAFDAQYWDLRYCTTGRHAWRIVIPVKLNGLPIAFLTRTFRNGNPKYLSSTHETEMGRPGEAILFNLDAVRPKQPVILVEGAGDVMGHFSRNRDHVHNGQSAQIPGASDLPPVTVSLLGTRLTDEKAALLAAKHPGPIIVALDADMPDSESLDVMTMLFTWGLDARFGTWTAGKDAGAGGQLIVSTTTGLSALVAKRLRPVRR